MKNTITFHAFQREFEAYGRGDQFSYQGLKHLFDYLQELEDDTGCDIELDVVGLCCQFAEYDTESEAMADILGYVEDEQNEGGAREYHLRQLEERVVSQWDERRLSDGQLLWTGGLLIDVER